VNARAFIDADSKKSGSLSNGGSSLADVSIGELFMPYSLTTRLARAALGATFLMPLAGAALAQSADSRSTVDIEKENATLRAKVHRLEAEKENIGWRAKVDQLQGRRPAQSATAESAQAAPYPLVTRIETTSPDRTLIMADMPMKAAPAPVPYYSWSGFYFGGNIGYGVGIDRSNSSLIQGTSNSFTAADSAVTPSGAIGGVQFGYNWQGGPNWLVGFEADFQGSAQKATSCVQSCLTFPGESIGNITSTQSLDYFGTVRGRFGFVDRSNVFYVTGGGAYGHVNHSLEVLTAQFTPPASSFDGVATTSDNKFGWVVGAGMESSLGGNWTAKVEYLYMDLGSMTTVLSGNAGAGGGPFTATVTSNIHDNIVRAGLNYRFGPPAGPVSAYDAMAAAPPPVFSWTGFYTGVNAGYGFGNDHNQTDLIAPGFSGSAITSPPGTSVTPKGGLGGVQVGYNWQASPHWVAGFEADLQGTAQNDTACSSTTCEHGFTPAPIDEIITVQHQIDYFGTVRGRLGYVYNNTLFYGTGGAAFGHVRESLHLAFSGLFADQSNAKDLAGYTVGGGIEAMLAGGWSAKAEYLFLDLGSISSSVSALAPGGGSVGALSNSTVRDHIVRLGLNYHIGPAPY
jgi:outer membrane immunogenic protein